MRTPSSCGRHPRTRCEHFVLFRTIATSVNREGSTPIAVGGSLGCRKISSRINVPELGARYIQDRPTTRRVPPTETTDLINPVIAGHWMNTFPPSQRPYDVDTAQLFWQAPGFSRMSTTDFRHCMQNARLLYLGDSVTRFVEQSCLAVACCLNLLN